jgi:glycosylphosphatidylinositol transamidase (GPIT) subunit GPI8
MLVYNHIVPAISGACGELSFHPETHTIIQYSTYSLKYMTNFKFYQADYISRADGKNTSSVYGAWEWNKIFDQDFDLNHEDTDLIPKKGNKAVLIAASSGWSNYRHQADILSYYQLLKGRGFSDDDIILIMADDLAYNKHNPHPGTIIGANNPTKNLYENVITDYKLDELSAEDLKSILLGQSSAKLPVVLDSDEQDNLLFIWSGHGLPQTLLWGENQKTIKSTFIKDLLQAMHDNGKYRKMLGLIEACYSGSIAMECVGIPKVLMMTATNDKETSKAENYDINWGTYLTNTFSSAVLNKVSKSIDTSIKDLYTDVFSMTMGSHVTIYNEDYFGNVFYNFTDEYFSNN